MDVVKAENLSKIFRVKQKEKGMKGSIQAVFHPQIKEVRAVDGVSFRVKEGEILAFIGPNGAGKSTTIKMLTGILYPDGGSAEVLGMNPLEDAPEALHRPVVNTLAHPGHALCHPGCGQLVVEHPGRILKAPVAVEQRVRIRTGGQSLIQRLMDQGAVIGVPEDKRDDPPVIKVQEALRQSLCAPGPT